MDFYYHELVLLVKKKNENKNKTKKRKSYTRKIFLLNVFYLIMMHS